MKCFCKKFKSKLFQKCIKIINEFLRDHQQCVKLQNHYSSWITLTHGAPQCIVLGPVIFILQVNYFKNQINTNLKLVQFSDDASVIYIGNSIKELRTWMLETLEKILENLIENKLVLNVDKTEIIVIGEENNWEKLFYREEKTTAMEQPRYLGILADQNLTFSAELNTCISKMAVAVKSIYSVWHMVPLEQDLCFSNH